MTSRADKTFYAHEYKTELGRTLTLLVCRWVESVCGSSLTLERNTHGWGKKRKKGLRYGSRRNDDGFFRCQERRLGSQPRCAPRAAGSEKARRAERGRRERENRNRVVASARCSLDGCNCHQRVKESFFGKQTNARTWDIRAGLMKATAENDKEEVKEERATRLKEGFVSL